VAEVKGVVWGRGRSVWGRFRGGGLVSLVKFSPTNTPRLRALHLAPLLYFFESHSSDLSDLSTGGLRSESDQ